MTAGLSVRDLTVTYGGRRGRAAIRAVRGVSLTVAPGQVVGLVGESGCGKSSLARALVGLEPSTGEIALDGAPLTARRNQDQARQVQMVFQDPYASLNPRRSIGSVLTEALAVHGLRARADRPTRVAELLALVGLDGDLASARPAGLSGGQRQRVAIARALAVEPRFLVADEPTASLDVSVQALVLDLFADLRDRLGLGIVLITHNLGVVSAICEQVAVMYAGQVVEHGPTADVITDPQHAYTRTLLAAVPRLPRVDS